MHKEEICRCCGNIIEAGYVICFNCGMVIIEKPNSTGEDNENDVDR